MGDLLNLTQFHKAFFEQSNFLNFGLHADGRIATVNPCCRNKLAADSDLIGIPFDGLVHEDDKGVFHEGLAAVGNGSNLCVELTVRLAMADGRFFLCSGELFKLATSPNPHGVIGGAFQDRTEKRQIELETLRMQRLHCAGQVAGQIAHDFNNLLAPLTAYPAMIREELQVSHTISRLLAEMESAATQIAAINHQLLELSRRTQYRLEPLDINSLIDDTLFSISLRPRTEVHLNLASGLAYIMGGAQQLSRVLVNLISNAEESMPEGGGIVIRTKQIVLTEAFPGFHTIPQGNYVQLSILDEGHGIGEEIREKIYEPFFTTRRASKGRGAGLGLSIACSIMADHDSYISFESNQQGTSFSLYFPFSEIKHNRPSLSKTRRNPRSKTLLATDEG